MADYQKNFESEFDTARIINLSLLDIMASFSGRGAFCHSVFTIAVFTIAVFITAQNVLSDLNCIKRTVP